MQLTEALYGVVSAWPSMDFLNQLPVVLSLVACQGVTRSHICLVGHFLGQLITSRDCFLTNGVMHEAA